MAAAGVFTGLQCFIDSIMYASNVFAGSPDLAIAIQSSLVGYSLMQLFVTYFSGVRVLIAPVSYEVIPFLVSLSAIVRAAVPAAALTPTMLAASCVVNGLAALLLGLLSFLPISAEFMAKLLPPVLQSGVMVKDKCWEFQTSVWNATQQQLQQHQQHSEASNEGDLYSLYIEHNRKAGRPASPLPSDRDDRGESIQQFQMTDLPHPGWGQIVDSMNG